MTEPFTKPRPDPSSRFNPALLQHLPRDAGIVLEVGCGSGALGAAFLPFNPACRYLGIEIDPALAATARQRLSTVVEGDAERVERDALPLAASEAVDVIVYGNVLEHLRDPWTLLARQSAWLARDGMVLASIPNVQHWSLLANLLHGKWQYQDEGLLDRSQLRFFTMDGIREMFTDAGLTIHDIIPRVFQPKAFTDFQQAMAPTLLALGIDTTQFKTQTGALQYVVRAGRMPAPRRICINALTRKPVAGLNEVRIDQPLRFQATIPGTQISIQTASGKGNAFPPFPGAEQVLVWQRPVLTRPHSIQVIRQLIKKQTLLVVEFDDHPGPFDEIANHDHLTFRAAHALQTSTEPLAALLRQYNPEVAVFPNCVAELPPPRTQSRSSADETVIFFGAINRENDWAPILPVLNDVLAGPVGHRVRVDVVHDRAFFNALTTPHKRFTATCPYPRYLELLRGADIALLPLADTAFNRVKSDLKFIESAAQGAVALASPVVYANTVIPGETGLIFADPAEFAVGLRALITDAELRHRLASAAYRYVAAERLLAQHYHRRQEWYHHLLTDRGRLTAAIRQRVPELMESPQDCKDRAGEGYYTMCARPHWEKG